MKSWMELKERQMFATYLRWRICSVKICAIASCENNDVNFSPIWHGDFHIYPPFVSLLRFMANFRSNHIFHFFLIRVISSKTLQNVTILIFSIYLVWSENFYPWNVYHVTRNKTYFVFIIILFHFTYFFVSWWLGTFCIHSEMKQRNIGYLAINYIMWKPRFTIFRRSV